LLHGGFGTVEDFASQTPELAKHFRVVAFERPGHGHTADSDGPFSYDAMSEYTAELIEALKLGRRTSLGGATERSSLFSSQSLGQTWSNASSA
jgi:pimeloyl-ACP methyl ester carboxylesterase